MRAGLLLSCLGACTPAPEDACETALDGVCQELVGCPLGADSTDCDAACEETPWPGGSEAACAHDRAVIPLAQLAEDHGTWGSGGVVGTWDGTVSVRGGESDSLVDRHFRVYVPQSYHPDRPIPVVFNLGGFTVDMYWLAEFTELNRTADLNNFIVVYGQPEWRWFNTDWVFAWYVYRNAWEGGWDDNPDLAYLAAVLAELGTLYNLDWTQTYLSGHSRGAALSLMATFERPDLFAGFCAQAGFIESQNYESRMADLVGRHFGAYLLHGKQDEDVPVSHSNAIRDELEALGWEEDLTYVYNKLPGVTHEWQPQYNQQVWDFLSSLPLEMP